MRKRGGPAHEWPSTVADPAPARPGAAFGASAYPSPHPHRSTGNSFAGDPGSASEDGEMAAAMSASVKDRTREFAAAAERAAKTLAQRQGGGPPTSSGSTGVSVGDATNPLLPGSASHPSSSAPSQAAGTNSEFAKMSSRIGHGIHGTSQKLEKLTALAKRSSMFDDPAREIAELSAVIKSDITALNTAIAELQNHAARVSATKQGSDHSVTVVDTLKTRLMGATKSFKEVLTMRQENVKAQSERRKMFSNESKVPNRPNPFARPRGPDGKMVGGGAGGAAGNFPRLADGGMGSAGGGGGPGGFLQGGTRDAGGFDGHITGNNYGNAQNQVLLANQDAYMNSRSEALQNVERTITELGGIFQQLSTMVAEQGEMAVRIDENVEQSVANVDAAQTQLLKYLNSVSSNRWLIMKIFGVLISFLVFFIVFIA